MHENRRMFTILYCKAALGLQMFSHPTCRDDASTSDSGLACPLWGKYPERRASLSDFDTCLQVIIEQTRRNISIMNRDRM